MAKGEAKKTNTMLDSSLQQSNSAFGSAIDIANRGLTRAIPGSTGLRDQIQGLYGQAAETGLMPSGLTKSGGFYNLPAGMGGTGGINFGSIGDYAKARGTYSDLSETGGDFGEAEGAFRTLSRGHVDNADAIRYRATSQIPSIYGNLKNNLARRSNVQGGYGPGFDAQTAELTRQAGREAFGASRMAEADIADRMGRAREVGASGLGNIAGMRQQGRIAGAQGLFGLGQQEQQAQGFNAGMADSAANRNAQMQMQMLGMEQQGKLAGMGGLLDAYRSSPGEVGMYLDTLMGGASGRAGAASNILGLRAQNNPNISAMDRVMQGAGIGAGVLGAFYGGGGGIRSPRR